MQLILKQDYYLLPLILIKYFRDPLKETYKDEMNILILGYSSLVRRKVINVLIKKGIKFSIASKSSKKKESSS